MNNSNKNSADILQFPITDGWGKRLTDIKELERLSETVEIQSVALYQKSKTCYMFIFCIKENGFERECLFEFNLNNLCEDGFEELKYIYDIFSTKLWGSIVDEIKTLRSCINNQYRNLGLSLEHRSGNIFIGPIGDIDSIRMTLMLKKKNHFNKSLRELAFDKKSMVHKTEPIDSLYIKEIEHNILNRIKSCKRSPHYLKNKPNKSRKAFPFYTISDPHEHFSSDS